MGLAVVQLNIFVNSVFASKLGDGPLSHLNYAFRLYYLPIGLFGVALGTVATTTAAEAAARNDHQAIRENTVHAMKNVFLLALPSVTGLIALSVPTVRLLFEYGRFRPDDTQETALVLSAYMTGLVFTSTTKVLEPVFYAINRPRIPLAGSMSAVGVNIVFNWLTYRTLGAPGLALGTALGSLADFIVQFAAAAIILEGINGREVAASFFKLAAVSLAIGGAAWGVWTWLETGPLNPLILSLGRAPGRFLLTFIPIGAAVGLYAAILKLIRAPEADELFHILGRVKRKIAG
jgi:putative peptidoglycan lipid II flippase